MTYGEWRVWRVRNARYTNGEAWFPESRHKPRMDQDTAKAYYTMKLRDAWVEEGYQEVPVRAKNGAWKDFWHMAEHVVNRLPLSLQKAIREVFAFGYALGYELGKEDGEKESTGGYR